MKRRSFLRTATICCALLFFIFPDFASDNSTGNAVKVGFSSIDLESCIKSERDYRLPLEAKCMVIEGNGQNILIYTLDFMEVFKNFAGMSRQKSARN